MQEWYTHFIDFITEINIKWGFWVVNPQKLLAKSRLIVKINESNYLSMY